MRCRFRFGSLELWPSIRTARRGMWPTPEGQKTQNGPDPAERDSGRGDICAKSVSLTVLEFKRVSKGHLPEFHRAVKKPKKYFMPEWLTP